MERGLYASPCCSVADEYPPVDEVQAQRWDYQPCPSISRLTLAMSNTFIASMLAPMEDLSASDYWLQMLPKKLHSEVNLEHGTPNYGWGIHITEGVNTVGVVLVALFIITDSCVVGVAYGVATKNVSTACAIAGVIAALSGLSVSLLQLRRR